MKHLAFTGFCIFLLYYLMLINGCNLMKKTSKTDSKEVETAAAKAELTQLDLTKAVKETNVFLYRTDGTLQGHASIKEQVDKTGYGTAKLENNATSKKEVVKKESIPDKTLIWTVAVFLCAIAIVVYIKYLR